MKLTLWATEINKDWTAGYNATATDESLVVTFNNAEVARMDCVNGRYTVSGDDEDAVKALEHLLSR